MPKLPSDTRAPLGFPKRLKKTITLSAMQLRKTIETNRRKKAIAELAIRTAKSGVIKKSTAFPPNTPFYRFKVFNKVKRHDHKVTIFFPDTPGYKPSAPVIVDCDCSDFTFTWEHVLAKRTGNACIWRCNGDPPRERNPGNKIGTCAHVYMALKYCATKYRDGKASLPNSQVPLKINLRKG